MVGGVLWSRVIQSYSKLEPQDMCLQPTSTGHWLWTALGGGHDLEGLQQSFGMGKTEVWCWGLGCGRQPGTEGTA